MKTLRILLLLLLAVLVPVRGAIAAAAPCTEQGAHHHARHAVMQLHEGQRVQGDAHALSGARASTHHHEPGAADKCNLCASCCSATPMPTSFATTIARLEEPAAAFPVVQASASSFVSDGQERPPRTR